jgi:hypothetical protein
LTREEVYNGVKGAMALYGGLFKRLSDEIGLEAALRAHAELQEPSGHGWAKLLEGKLGGRELNMDVFSEVYRSISGSGVENVYELSGDSFRVLGHQCPVYDGLRGAGLDHETVRLMCEGAGGLIFGALREHYPMVEAGITFRDDPEGHCVEWYRLTKHGKRASS